MFIQKRLFSVKWMQQKLASSTKTVSMVVHQDEVKAGEYDSLIGGLSKSQEFRQDLNMSGAYWFYHQNKRVLLLQKSKDKPDAKPEDIKKSYRSLGVTACASLQSKKVDDVQFLVSKKVANENLGVFENSFMLSNYENIKKKFEAKEEENKDEDYDVRTEKVGKRIKSFTIETEEPYKDDF